MNIKQIAEIVGCSPSTVSRVLSDKDGNVPISAATKNKVLKVCQEHEYKPNVHASRFFSRRSKNIGMLLPEAIYLSDSNLLPFLNGAFQTIDAKGYRMTLLSSNQKFLAEKNHINVFKTKEVDALLIWGCTEKDDYIDELFESGYPFVLVGNKKNDYSSVVCDDEKGMLELIAHCEANACSRFTYISSDSFDASVRRLSAFKLATRGNGKVLEYPRDHSFTSKDVDAIMRTSPDVIMCMNDSIAYEIITALKKVGLNAPADVKVTGIDNTNFSAKVSPSITTYDQMAEACSRKAIQMLLAHLEDGKQLYSVLVNPEIRIRESA